MNRLRTKRRYALVAALLAMALIAAACGGDDDTADTTAAPADATTTSAAAAGSTTAAPDGTTTSGAPGAEVPTALTGLTKVDDLTFEVELSVADPEFPLRLGYTAFYPLPAVALEDPAAFEEAPIGNGPFMMNGTWEHDVRIPLTAYPDYAGDDAPQVENFTFQIYADVNTAYTDALAGNLDIVDTVPPDFLATYQTDFPDRNAEFETTSFTYLGMPMYLEQFTADHRRALSMAIDKPQIMESIFLGARDPAFSAIPPSVFGREDVCPNWNFDPEAARALWERAGDPGPFEVWFNAGSGHELWVEAVVNMWGENLGLDPSTITFQSLEFAEYLPVVDAGELTGPYRLGWLADYLSPFNFLDPLYTSTNVPPVGSNSFRYDNPEFDAVLLEGREAFAETGNLEDALPFYYEAEDMVCNDVPVIPIYFLKNQTVWSEGTDNVQLDAFSRLDYTSVTAEDGEVTYYITEPEHLFPTTTNESEGSAVLSALFVGPTTNDPVTSELVMGHAESVESDDGGKTWTITLKPDWTFHNGDPVTSDSYINAWNFAALGANGQQNNSFFSNIIGYTEMNPPTEEDEG